MEAPLLITLPHSVCKPCEELMDALGNDIPENLKIVEATKPENYKILVDNNAFVEKDVNGEIETFIAAPMLITPDKRRVVGVQRILEELKRE